jgi:hypothetical protein
VALVQRFENYQDKYATSADVFEQKPQITTALATNVVQEELVRELRNCAERSLIVILFSSFLQLSLNPCPDCFSDKRIQSHKFLTFTRLNEDEEDLSFPAESTAKNLVPSSAKVTDECKRKLVC